MAREHGCCGGGADAVEGLEGAVDQAGGVEVGAVDEDLCGC